MKKNLILCLLLFVLIGLTKAQSPCDSNPCPAITHLCYPTIDSYSCLCVNPICFATTTTTPPTTTESGATIVTPVDFCADSPCPIGHRCVSFSNTFSCFCVSDVCRTTTTVLTSSSSTTKISTTTIPTESLTTISTASETTTTTTTSTTTTTATTVTISTTTTTITTTSTTSTTTTSTTTTTTTSTTTTTTSTTVSFLLDICSPNPCLNNGNCVQTGPSTAICQCLPNFTGFLCEQQNSCISNPCLNGGTCYPLFSTLNNYRCQCPFKFHGKNCEINLNTICTSTTCLNGGTCSIVPESGTNKCSCTPFYTGNRCETAFNPCFSLSGIPTCQNNGQCILDYGAFPYYRCSCKLGFSGDKCEISPTTTRFTTLSSSRPDNCVDQNVETCPYYKANSYCSNFYFINNVPIPTYCALSCGTCEPITTETPCVDTQPSCQFWGSSGNCGLLPDPRICRLSCGLC